ncbi:MAG: glycogen debranching protein GlgX, partial [Rubrivivax sp.]
GAAWAAATRPPGRTGVLERGRAWPLGAQAVAGGVNFAVHAPHATAVEVCLFEASGQLEQARLALPGHSGAVWHGLLPGARAGLVYGLRVHGPWAPEHGNRFSPHKLLLDPWAQEIVGRFEHRDEHHASHPADNAPWALKARVVQDTPEWHGDQPPQHAWSELAVLELHVKGFTMRHPGVPEPLRGTYAGLASPASIAHLRRLGITAVSLLPVYQHVDEAHLQRLGLRNYWGYNTVGFFCPEPTYAAARDGAGVRAEFREMVRTLHAAGIEVWLDVVYNHTAEGDERGPTIAWRGLDNRAWYRLPPGHPAGYENFSGCGNTLDIRRPGVMRLVLDSLRHWVQAYHVDGFRFDLAPVLARGDTGFEHDAPFFQALAQDPVLAGTRLVAEPWDVGPGGYRLGHFPPGWAEWNDRFRDTMRAFWLGHPTHRGELARRLAGSADHFRARGRLPSASVNYVTAHDGFTLLDAVSYTSRRNHANGEDNRDGHPHNYSTGAGAEGPIDDPEVRARRQALQRALLACTMLAQGTPMLTAGCELGHTQGGNNNAYCQDNELSWLDWEGADTELTAYVAHLGALRRELLPLHDVWHDPPEEAAAPDGQARQAPRLVWRQADGSPLQAHEWHDPDRRDLAMLVGEPGRVRTPLLLLFNAHESERRFELPPGLWRPRLDSSAPTGEPPPISPAAEQAAPDPGWCVGSCLLGPHAVVLLQRVQA